jgi:hypothetical protein
MARCNGWKHPERGGNTWPLTGCKSTSCTRPNPLTVFSDVNSELIFTPISNASLAASLFSVEQPVSPGRGLDGPRRATVSFVGYPGVARTRTKAEGMIHSGDRENRHLLSTMMDGEGFTVSQCEMRHINLIMY